MSFVRSAPGMGGAAVPLRYGVVGGALVRTVGPAPQLVLAGVANARGLQAHELTDEPAPAQPVAAPPPLRLAAPLLALASALQCGGSTEGAVYRWKNSRRCRKRW